MNAVHISRLDRTIAEAMRQVQNGRFMAAAAGIDTDLKKSLAFTFNVALDDGINAIDRNDVAITAADQVSRIEDGAQETNEYVSQRNEISSGSESQSASENQSGSEAQSTTTTQNFGRQTEVDITYES